MNLVAANDNDTMTPMWVIALMFMDHLKRKRREAGYA